MGQDPLDRTPPLRHFAVSRFANWFSGLCPPLIHAYPRHSGMAGSTVEERQRRCSSGRVMHRWRLLPSGGKQMEPTEPGASSASPDTREFTFAKEISQLKRLPAEKVQEDFQRCLAKVEARRRCRAKRWREGIYDQIREMMSMQGNLSVERMCVLAMYAGLSHRSFQISENQTWRKRNRERPSSNRDRAMLSWLPTVNWVELRHRGFSANHKRVARTHAPSTICYR